MPLLTTPSLPRELLQSGLLGLAAAAALHVAEPRSVAQQPGRQPPPGVQSSAGTNQADGMPRVTLNFPGGTVAQFCRAVQKAVEPAAINIVVSSDAAEVALPPVEYKQVAVSSALEALPMAAYNEHARYTLRVQAVGQAWDGSGVYSISATQMQQFGSPYQGMPGNPVMRTPQRVETFSVRDLIDPPSGNPGVSIDTVLTAVDTAIALDPETKAAAGAGGGGGGGGAPEVRFHKESGILIVRGDQDQLRTVKDLLNSLREDVDGRERQAAGLANERQGRAKKKLDIEHALAKAKLELDVWRQEVAAAHSSFQRARERFQAGSESQDELSKAELEVSRREHSLQMATLEVEKIARQMEMLEMEGQRPDPIRGGGGMGSGTRGESAIVVVYDVRDLRPFLSDVTATVSAVALADGAPARSAVSQVGDDAGNLAVTTTPSRHRAIISALNLLRRAKANDPKLQGLNADDLLKSATPPKD